MSIEKSPLLGCKWLAAVADRGCLVNREKMLHGHHQFFLGVERPQLICLFCEDLEILVVEPD
jgi:hypothetical protein